MNICQICGREFSVDVNVPDEIWEQIKPVGKPRGGGLMCGFCIVESYEKIGYGVTHANSRTTRDYVKCAKEISRFIYNDVFPIMPDSKSIEKILKSHFA